MNVIKSMVAEASSRPEQDQIKLVAERRLFLKRRWRGEAEDGTEFGFDLETRLVPGAVFHQTEEKDYVIWQQTEMVYEIPVNDPGAAALVGWRIGNLHFPVQILADRIRVAHDPAIQQLLDREGWIYAETSEVFRPLRVIAHAV